MRTALFGVEADATRAAGGDEALAIELHLVAVDLVRVGLLVQVHEVLVRSANEVGRLVVVHHCGAELDGLVSVGLAEVGVVIDDSPSLPGVLHEVHDAVAGVGVEGVIGAEEDDVVRLNVGQGHVRPPLGAVRVKHIVRALPLVEEGQRDGAEALGKAIHVVRRHAVLLHEIPDDPAHAIVAQLTDEQRLHAHPTERNERVEDRSAGQGRVRLSVAEEDVEDGLTNADHASHASASFRLSCRLFDPR